MIGRYGGAARLSHGVSLKPDRERADTLRPDRDGRDGRRGGRREGRSGLSDGYYLSMEIDLERCQSPRDCDRSASLEFASTERF